jgi:hypothetical protein
LLLLLLLLLLLQLLAVASGKQLQMTDQPVATWHGDAETWTRTEDKKRQSGNERRQ